MGVIVGLYIYIYIYIYISPKRVVRVRLLTPTLPNKRVKGLPTQPESAENDTGSTRGAPANGHMEGRWTHDCRVLDWGSGFRV